MRIGTYILTVYFSAMIMLPGLTELSCGSADTAECEYVCTGESPENCQDLPDEGQNSCPYGQCLGNCMVYMAGPSVFQFNEPIVFLIAKKEKRPVNDGLYSNYLADCWHPPEIV